MKDYGFQIRTVEKTWQIVIRTTKVPSKLMHHANPEIEQVMDLIRYSMVSVCLCVCERERKRGRAVEIEREAHTHKNKTQTKTKRD